MKKKMRLILIFSACLFLFSCATTTDPSKGGLFSYNPEAYKKRQAEMKNKLEQTEMENKTIQRETEQNEATKLQKKEQRDLLTLKVAEIDNRVIQLDNLINQKRKLSQKQEQVLWRLNIRLESLKKDLANSKGNDSEDIEAQERQVVKLNQRIDELLQEAEELSKM
jgi:hypothetical protein